MRDGARRRWLENTVLYSLDVATFADGNGDGVGDFVGLIDRLDYISGLGVNTLWLLPFHGSPNGDNRNDVTDYYSVDPSRADRQSHVDRSPVVPGGVSPIPEARLLRVTLDIEGHGYRWFRGRHDR